MEAVLCKNLFEMEKSPNASLTVVAHAFKCQKAPRRIFTTMSAVAAVLTASADVDVQVAFDYGAAFERLRGVHRVDDLLIADFIAQAIAGRAEHAGDGQR